MPDFQLGISIQVTSPVLPNFLLGKYKDDVLLFKRGASLRMDFSLLPTDDKKVKIQKSSFFYNPLNIDPKGLKANHGMILANHEKGTFSTPLSRIDISQKRAILKDIFFKVGQEMKDSSSHTVEFRNMCVETNKTKDGVEKYCLLT